jgi:FkbM family methyltransferase
VPKHRWQGVFDIGDNIRLDLDLATYPDVAMAGRVYELDTQRLLRQLLRPGITFLDGGANLGYFTCQAARWVGDAGHVHAVEADPINRGRLQKNLDRNGSANVTVHAVGIAEKAGVATFGRPVAGRHRNHGESGRFPPTDVPSEQFDVTLARLDELLPEPPDVVKLDIEGSEDLAIEGATGWLRSDCPPTWILEHNPGVSHRINRRPGDLYRHLLAHHPAYRCTFLAGRRVPLTTPEAVDEWPHDGNLLFEP